MFSGGFDNIGDDDFSDPEEDFSPPDSPNQFDNEIIPAGEAGNAAPDTPEDTQPAPTPMEQEAPPSPEKKPAPVKKASPEEATIQALLDTPRTREAFKRSGIRKAELKVKSYQDFYVRGDLPQQQKLRHEHYEAKRMEKTHMVQLERQRVINERGIGEGGSAGDNANYASLQLMEGLLDTEAKKLEKSLRAQLRYHQSVERENVLQLDKESSLESKLGYRKERQQLARAQFGAKSKQLSEVQEAKTRHVKEIMSSLEQQEELKKADTYATLLDQEARLRAFEKEKSLRNAEKSEKWKAKCKLMQQRKEAEDLQKEIKGHKQLEHLHEKLEVIELRREDLAVKRKVKHQEESLKLVDAKDKIKRLERKEEFRRNLLRENLESQEERIDTLLKLREQILEQRKVRIKQQSVVKGRPQNIRDNTPGPAHYQPLPSCLNEMPVTKISTAEALNLMPGSIDMMIKKSKAVPPPGAYVPTVLPDGNHLDLNVIDGQTTKIVKGSKPRQLFVDEIANKYKHNPGPGNYDVALGNDLRHSVRIVRDYVDTSELPPKWINNGFVPDTPGPDEYVLDKFSKKGRAKAANSAPHLAGALRMKSR